MRFWGMFRFTVEEAMRKGTLIFYFVVATIILLLLTLGISHPVNDTDMVTLLELRSLAYLNRDLML